MQHVALLLFFIRLVRGVPNLANICTIILEGSIFEVCNVVFHFNI